MTNVAIVGSGLIGASWSIVFARAGYDVAIYDPSPLAMKSGMEFASNYLQETGDPKAAARLKPVSTLVDAVRGAHYVQESGPEMLEVKRELYSELSRLTSEDTILASSTSGFPASAFAEHVDVRRRCIVSHPINPPHLIPLVEIVPSTATSPSVTSETQEIMRRCRQIPILLKREINGFVVNRLQSAILAEAFRLIEDGVASVSDVDLAVSEGLALRWFFMGPFETIDLNAQGGVADYCRKLGPMYFGLAKEQANPRQWDESLVSEVEAQRRQQLRADSLGVRRLWRDRCLAKLIAAKRAVLSQEDAFLARTSNFGQGSAR